MHPFARAALASLGAILLTVSFGLIGFAIGLAVLVGVVVVAVRDGGDDWTPPPAHRKARDAEEEARLRDWTGESGA